MNFNTRDEARNQCMLSGPLRRRGYDWWWHSFSARDVQTGEERAFFVEYFLVNPALGGERPVFGQLPENKVAGRRPSYVMVKAGCWGKGARQLHRFFGWQEARVRMGAPFEVEAGDCFASETELRGSVEVSAAEAAAHPEWMCGAGSMRWDLKLDKKIAFNVGYGTSAPLRAIKAFEMYWHAQGMKTQVSGTVWLDGRRYAVDGPSSFGYVDKNWGHGFTTPWVWLSSCDLTSRITGERLADTAFDIGGGRPKVFFVGLPRKLLGAIWHEGRGFEFNFSKFWTGSRTRFECREEDERIVWHVEQDTWAARLVTDVWCEKADMLLVNYEAPDGSKRHNRLWNGGNGHGRLQLFEKRGRELVLVDDMDAAHVGCEYGEYD
ncbi:hypothetical protein [Paratractidigestivibacter sp.]|uniref:hypothetical protein n=1 Tax=Paratractidigestivibacter sp. TaxID=2847316 RepID=UPI002AC9370E|nr:hypothetical protein [Paratractidigestivibacter sp.]